MAENMSQEHLLLPTVWLCNDAYWHALHKYSGNIVFIHVPTIRHADEISLEKMKLAISRWLEKQ